MLSRFAMLLMERRRRAAQAQAVTPEMEAWTERMRPIADRLRGEMHPKQRAFWAIRVAGQATRALRRAAKTTRRSGKTSGGTREVLARCVEFSGYRAVYCNTTLAEALKLVWRSDTGRDGWLELLRIHGFRVAHKRAEMESGKADCFVDDRLHVIEFRNGSQIAIFCADDAASIEKIRGQAKHLVWIDEAQKFGHLQTFVEDILEGNLTDFVGELLLTGTPSKAAGSYYYDVTKEPNQGERAEGWEVHEWSLLDNPFFGPDETSRFNRALLPRILRAQPRKSQLSPEAWVAKFCGDPPGWYSREYLGKWILTDAFFVYAIHTVPANERTYAPMRTTHARPFSPEGKAIESIDMSLGWYDHQAALEDLPRRWTDHRGKKHSIRWLVAAAFDFGFHPDPFAVNLTAWSLDVEDLYELWSWKQVELHVDDQRDVVRWVLANVDGITVCVGDAGGLQKGHLQGWRERLGVQIEDAEKASKATWIALLSGEISAGRYNYRDGSPLLDEHEHLLWQTDKNGELIIPHQENADRALSDRRVPGNHCSDCGLYGFRHLVGRRTEFTGRDPADPDEAIRRDEAEMERDVDRRTMSALREERDDDYAGSGYE